jgi:hypothetical protein
MDNSILVIQKYLKKKKERVLLDLYIRDYNKSNFYIALVFNKRIEKFKVLFVPLDVCENKYIDDYVCYQFIDISSVNYILNTINDNDKLIRNDIFRNKINKYINSYYIEINTHINKRDYKFVTTRYIPSEWLFMFDVIVTLFERIPSFMNELCREILAVFSNSNEAIDYKYSIDFDLVNDDFSTLLFDTSEVHEVLFLEFIGGKYFAIVNNVLVVVEYNPRKILNLYCSSDDDSYIYSVLVAIRNKSYKKFYKLMVVDDKHDFEVGVAEYYLCYGLEKGKFLIISGDKLETLDKSLYDDGLIKILDSDLELDEKLGKI